MKSGIAMKRKMGCWKWALWGVRCPVLLVLLFICKFYSNLGVYSLDKEKVYRGGRQQNPLMVIYGSIKQNVYFFYIFYGSPRI